MFREGKFTTTIGNYGGRLPPEEGEVDFQPEFGGDMQLTIGDEVLDFRGRVGDTLSGDEGIDDLLKQMGIDDL